MPDRRPAGSQGSVLFVGAANRSGSTLLDRVLGQIDGHVSVGELMNLWARGLSGERLCGCGNPIPDCPFWSEVGKRAFGGFGQFDHVGVQRLASKVTRMRYLPMLLAPSLFPGYRRRLEELSPVLEDLYSAVVAVSGSRVIVDSSKNPAYAMVLRRATSFDVRIAHLVRDPRGVAYSLVKKRMRQDVPMDGTEMPRVSPMRAALAWDVSNLAYELIRWLGVPTQRLRYERFANTPASEVDSLLHTLSGGTSPELDFLEPGGIRFSVAHTVDGNPMRSQTGLVPLAVDEGWRSGLPRRARIGVVALTWPLFLAYGYHHRYPIPPS